MAIWDKRHASRAKIAAVARISSGDDLLGVFPVANLSVNGVLVAGSPSVQIGDKVNLTLEIAGVQPVQLLGSTVRGDHDRGQATVAFAFEDLAGATEVAIDRMVWQQLLETQKASVLIVESSVSTSRELKFQLRCMGLDCHAVQTPTEALEALAKPNTYSVVLVGRGEDTTVALDFVAFLNHAQPRLLATLIPALAILKPAAAIAATPLEGLSSDRPWSVANFAWLMELWNAEHPGL